ncbi:MAG: hypothetical protein HPY52_01430 [Firmicutes bacterium]|nr:hypothetical protein [Bacillota bacterium]
MAPNEVLKALWENECTIMVEGDSLVVTGYLTDDLRQEIRNHKQEIISLLQSQTKRVEYVGNCPVLIINRINPLDFRRDPATGRWIHDPGWWRNLPKREGRRSK